jgi:ATP-binding cassette subfamily B protein
LDEPTSALDPWAEADWLERFRKSAGDRTAIVITHRLTTAMQADVIHVMEQGQIVESGSHGELIRENGQYAKSWAKQIAEAGDDLALAEL